MADHEILEKYRETIKKGVHQFCQKNHIEDANLKERVLQNYQKGFLEGCKEERKNIAKKMHAKGMNIKDVSELTGLAVEEIQALNP